MSSNSRTLGQHDTLNLTSPRYAVAISWDHGGKPVDLDLQAVVVDARGAIIDAVYYNNMKALKCMTHSGDEQTGERSVVFAFCTSGIRRISRAYKGLIEIIVFVCWRPFMQRCTNGLTWFFSDRLHKEPMIYHFYDSLRLCLPSSMQHIVRAIENSLVLIKWLGVGLLSVLHRAICYLWALGWCTSFCLT